MATFVLQGMTSQLKARHIIELCKIGCWSWNGSLLYRCMLCLPAGLMTVCFFVHSFFFSSEELRWSRDGRARRSWPGGSSPGRGLSEAWTGSGKIRMGAAVEGERSPRSKTGAPPAPAALPTSCGTMGPRTCTASATREW